MVYRLLTLTNLLTVFKDRFVIFCFIYVFTVAPSHGIILCKKNAVTQSFISSSFYWDEKIAEELRKYKNDSMDWNKLLVLNLAHFFSPNRRAKMRGNFKRTIFFSPSSCSYIVLSLEMLKWLESVRIFNKSKFRAFRLILSYHNNLCDPRNSWMSRHDSRKIRELCKRILTLKLN